MGAGLVGAALVVSGCDDSRSGTPSVLPSAATAPAPATVALLSPGQALSGTAQNQALKAAADGCGNTCDADVNHSGVVSTADFAILRATLNQSASSGPAAAAADLNGSGTVTVADFTILRARLGTAPHTLAEPRPSTVESWPQYWQRRLAGLPRLFTVDQVQVNQYLAGDGQEAAIARFPLVIAPQTYRQDNPTRAHLDAIRAYNPNSVLLAYQIPFEDVLPLNTGPGYDAMRHLRSIESAYMHDARGNRLLVTEASGTRGMFDPRSPDVRAAILAAVASVLQAYPHDGIFFDNYGVKNAMVLDPSGKQFTGAPGQVWSEADYAAKLDAMTTLTEEIRRAWPGALFIANSANLFPAFNGELVEGSGQYYRAPVQAAELPGRAQPFIPLFQDTPVTGPADPLIATRLAEVQARGGWYGASVANQRILPPAAFGF